MVLGAAKFADKYTFMPERVGDGGGLGDVTSGKRLRVRVHVVENGAVQAERRVRARVVVQPRIDRRRQLAPPPQRATRVAALD
jgi:hypothetical protein